MIKKLLALALSLVMLLSFVACAANQKESAESAEAKESYLPTQNSEVGIPTDGKWKEANFRENKTFGEGEKKITLYVVVEDFYVEFTVHTDKENLADALLEHKIVEGDENGPYGLYIKKVNGILADYEKDQTYWSFEIQGQAQVHGVSEEILEDGEAFELVLKK